MERSPSKGAGKHDAMDGERLAERRVEVKGVGMGGDSSGLPFRQGNNKNGDGFVA